MKQSKKPNIILLSFDTVRPDHLSCYGYKKIETPNIDKIAEEGVCFETCIASSIFTPVAMSTVLGGAYANKIGLRNMFSTIRSKLVSSVLQENGYKTTAFVGVCHLSSKHGFSTGFDTFREVTEETAWASHAGHKDSGGTAALAGYYWVDDFFKWLEDNYGGDEPFFMWGHFFETHDSSEDFLLAKGLIKEGRLPDFLYYDAKIEMADRELLGRLNKELKKLNIEDNTLVIVMADHGECLGEHIRDPDIRLTKKGENIVRGGKRIRHPAHSGMHDTDVKVPLIMKGPGLPSGKRIKGQVLTIDIVPTILDLLKIKPEDHFDHELDGVSLLPIIERGKSEDRVAYIEDLDERRVYGLQQAVRTDEYKYMRNLRDMEEEFYRLYRDPEERCNIMDIMGTEKLTKWERKLIDGWRREMNLKLWLTVGSSEELIGEEAIKERLRALGYISEE